MTDPLFSFDVPSTRAQPDPAPRPMTSEQRLEIRALFAALQVGDARKQFAVVKELTGSEITAVHQLSAASAHRLIGQLNARVREAGARRTGNAWLDREEDTWIDRL